LKKMALCLAVLIAHFFLNEIVGETEASTNNYTRFVDGQLGTYAFRSLSLSDFKGTSYSRKENSIFDWDSRLQITYAFGKIVPQASIRMAGQTFSEKHPGIFSDMVRPDSIELKQASAGFLPIITTSVRFAQKITDGFYIYYSPGVSFSYFEAYFEVYDKVAQKNIVILNERHYYFGPDFCIEPHLYQIISKNEYSKKSLFFASRYDVVFAEETFHNACLKLGITWEDIDRNTGVKFGPFTVYLFMSYDFSKMFESRTLGLGSSIVFGRIN